MRLTIHNVLGQTVRTLVEGEMGAGVHQAHWDGVDNAGREVSSGIYLYRLEAAGQTFSRKMVLLR